MLLYYSQRYKAIYILWNHLHCTLLTWSHVYRVLLSHLNYLVFRFQQNTCYLIHIGQMKSKNSSVLSFNWLIVGSLTSWCLIDMLLSCLTDVFLSHWHVSVSLTCICLIEMVMSHWHTDISLTYRFFLFLCCSRITVLLSNWLVWCLIDVIISRKERNTCLQCFITTQSLIDSVFIMLHISTNVASMEVHAIGNWN